jgi:hypothetical protein
MSSDSLREELASYAHKTWSGWMEYMFSKSHTMVDGSVVIPKDLVERWTRQMKTEYSGLPESERKYYRAEADKILSITQAHRL